MEAVNTSEISIKIYQTTHYNMPDDSHLHIHCCENLYSHLYSFFNEMLFICLQARKLEEHRRKYERKRAEKEMKEKLDRARRAREEHAKAAKSAEPQGDADGSGGLGGMGDFYQFFKDPDIMQAFEVNRYFNLC
jgi:hypothetical protein